MKVTTKLTQRVDIQNEEQEMIQCFMICEIESSRYLVCFLFMFAREIENELDLSLYSLSKKTSRYAHFGHNRLTVYGIRLAVCMLPLT